MASTLGILDVLDRLREESERASTALAVQEDTNRSLLHRCSEAEAESERTVAVKDALHAQKARLDQDRMVAECRRREVESKLKRLQAQQTGRDQAEARRRQEAVAAADDAVEASRAFRANAAGSVRQIRELRSRLQDKRIELESVREEKNELDGEIEAKKTIRDKVKAEVAAQAEGVASACSAVDDAERENKAILAKAKRTEGEVEETRQAREEMQEMAAGLQRKNAILRNELRHLNRQVQAGGDGPATGETHRSTSAARVDGGGVGHFYHHSPAPQQGRGRSPAALQFEASPYQQHRLNPDKTHNAITNNIDNSSTNSRTNNTMRNLRNSSSNLRAPFATAATAAMAMMPELRLSSPHPGGRSASQRNSATGPPSASGKGCGGRRSDSAARSVAMSVDSDEYGNFDYHA